MTEADNNANLGDDHARHERAKSAPIVGLLNSLASEVVLAFPEMERIFIWQSESDVCGGADLVCAHNSPSVTEVQGEDLLVGHPLESIGLRIVARRPFAARISETTFVVNKARWLKAVKLSNMGDQPPSGYWICNLDVNWKNNGYLVTLIAGATSDGRAPNDEQLSRFSNSLATFLKAAQQIPHYEYTGYARARSRSAADEDEPLASFSQLTESPNWTLPQIEETVLSRIRSAIPELSELHLFLTNPLDLLLYYAATDQLSIVPPLETQAGVIWKLPQLDANVQTPHVENRLRELEQHTGRATGSLVEFYRRIQTQGLLNAEIPQYVSNLRLVLRCLPQELSYGVVGAAVRDGVLTIGGKDYWDSSQWTYRKKLPFFAQKLEVEKLFGVAKDGFLTAAPVYDAGQVIGGLFFVTKHRPNQDQMSVLLDGCLHASALLAQFRTTQFTRSVIETLEREPQAQFQSVVERNLGQLLLYGMLAVVDTSQNTPRVTHAWYRSEGSIQLEPHDGPQVRQSPLLRSLYARMKEKNVWLMDIDREEWERDNLRTYYKEAHSCVLFPFDDDSAFLFLLAQPCERLLNSLPALQHKSASLQTVVSLRDTYARRHEVQKFHSNATFSWHNLKRRFSHPLLDIYNRMLGTLEDMEEVGIPVSELRDHVEEVGVIQAIMDSQFLALKDTVDIHDAVGRAAINIHYMLNTELKKYFSILLRSRDREVVDLYSEKVQLLIDCPRTATVRGHAHAFKMAMLSILENTVKDYAISKELVAQADPSRLQVCIVVRQKRSSVEISVSDTGEGMSSELCLAHNQRFRAISCGKLVGYQGFDRKLASSKDSGSQIGLLHAATVFAAIKSENRRRCGRITVRPHEPHGTCFVILLPTN